VKANVAMWLVMCGVMKAIMYKAKSIIDEAYVAIMTNNNISNDQQWQRKWQQSAMA